MCKTSFATFCLELYAEHKNIASTDVYSLSQSSELLNMLDNDYDDLHGRSMEYLIRFFSRERIISMILYNTATVIVSQQ